MEKKGEGETVMIPLLSKTENDDEFIEKAVKGAREVLLMLVVDNSAPETRFGFALQQMAQGNEMIGAMKAKIRKKRKIVNEIIEWGSTRSKIVNTAKLKNVDKVVVRAQQNPKLGGLVDALKAEKIEVEVI